MNQSESSCYPPTKLRGCLAAAMLLAGLPGWAQEAAQPPPTAKLKIVIIEGDGAINNIRQRVAREPIVQVTDENDRPVAGAAVVFFLPSSGAGGTFPDGSRIATVLTDENGRAVARGIRPNNLSGQFEIRVTASHEGATASATITQTNAVAGAAAGAGAGGAAAGGISAATKIALIVGIAAAGAAGAVVATKSGGNGGSPAPPSGPTAPPVPSATIGIGGGPVFGPPR